MKRLSTKKTVMIALCMLASMHANLIQTNATAGERIVAEPLVVDLRAEDVSHTYHVDIWPNRGTLADFTASGTPVAMVVDGLPAVFLDGESWFEGPVSVPEIEGDSPRSVEVVVYNPTIDQNNEIIVVWSHRGGPVGTYMSINYGLNSDYGAVAHWNFNFGWTGEYAPAPEPHKWWYFAYTYDGSTAKLFVNGEKTNSGSGILDTWPGDNIRVGCQNTDVGSASPFYRFSGFLSEVRIHGDALSDEAILHNYNCLVEQYFGTGEVLGHWPFDEGIGEVTADSTGHCDGIIYGADWTTGQSGRALYFDGVDDLVECGNIQADHLLTVNAWIKPGSFTPEASVVSKGGLYLESDFRLLLSDGYPAFECGNDDPTAPGFVRATAKSQLVEDEWAMISGARGRYEISVFIDAVKSNSSPLSFPSATRDLPVIIGGGAFEGVMDEVQIISGKLEEADLEAILDPPSGRR